MESKSLNPVTENREMVTYRGGDYPSFHLAKDFAEANGSAYTIELYIYI
jgi:hypothetical protein